MSDLLLGGYLPGDTVIHRLSPGWKFVASAVFGVVLVVVRSWQWGLVFLGFAVLLALIARLPLARLARAARGILVFVVIVSALQAWLSGWPKAVETGLDLFALAIFGLVFTSTTSVNEMLDALLRAFGPLRHVGVRPERVALVFTLAIHAIPGTMVVARDTREAARARGLRNPRAYLTPFVVRVVARAQDTGEALHARGLGD